MSKELKSTYIKYEEPLPPSLDEGISSSIGSKSSFCLSSAQSSLSSMPWFQSNDSLFPGPPERRSSFKSPKKLVEPLYKICDALSRKCSLKRAFSPKRRQREEINEPPKHRFLDFGSPEEQISKKIYRELDLTPLCQISSSEPNKGTSSGSRKLIVKRKSINEKFEWKRDLLKYEVKIEEMDRKQALDKNFSTSEEKQLLNHGPLRRRISLPKYSDLMPTFCGTSEISYENPRISSFTTSTPTKQRVGSIYKKRTPVNRHHSNASTFAVDRREQMPQILTSPNKVLHTLMRSHQAISTVRRNSMRRRQKTVEITYL